MSSSRSLASARTKRAVGNTTIPGINEQPDQPNKSTVQTPITKLSLPQAINRIGERLNNLELFSETTTAVVDEIQEFHTNTSDKYIIDTDVFTSLVSRIETLERTVLVKSESGVSTTSPTPSALSASSNVTGDIDEIRKHLVRLQTYVMETNAKLQDMLFSGNGTSLVTFNDIFSDSHPTPPTLMRNATGGSPVTSSEIDSEYYDTSAVEKEDNSKIVNTANNESDSPN
tara:strand:- start:534 stop:1220 length:687 start_codon:yes stop_codon:yes gene_type:complete